MKRAWIVMIIDVSTAPPTVRGAEIFSDPTPTMGTDLRTFAIGSFDGACYEDAADAAGVMLADDHCAWLGEFRRDDGRVYRMHTRIEDK